MVVRVVAGVWIESDKLLSALRRADRARGGVWELPGGKVEPGESDQQALARELQEELGAHVSVAPEPLAQCVHTYPDVQIHLLAYRVHAIAGSPPPEAREHEQLRWIGPEELEALAWAEADRRLLPPLRDLLFGGEVSR